MLDLNYLLIGAGILITVLSLWAQQWFNYGKSLPEEENDARFTTSLGLLWIYIAISFAIGSLGFALAGKYWGGITPAISEILHGLSLGFIIPSFLLSLSNIIESTFNIWRKFRSNKTAFQSLVVIPIEKRMVALRWIVGIPMGLLGASILGVMHSHLWWWISIPSLLGLMLYRYLHFPKS